MPTQSLTAETSLCLNVHICMCSYYVLLCFIHFWSWNLEIKSTLFRIDHSTHFKFLNNPLYCINFLIKIFKFAFFHVTLIREYSTESVLKKRNINEHTALVECILPIDWIMIIELWYARLLDNACIPLHILGNFLSVLHI